jgi:hypothetical protein
LSTEKFYPPTVKKCLGATENDDVDEEYTGLGTKWLGRAHGTAARVAATRGHAAGRGRNQAFDHDADLVPHFVAQNDAPDPHAADGIGDDLLSTYFDELNKASAGIAKYEALVLKGRNEVKPKGTGSSSSKARKPMKGLRKHAGDFSDCNCFHYHPPNFFFRHACQFSTLWHALLTLHVSTFLSSGTPFLLSTFGTPCHVHFPPFSIYSSGTLAYTLHFLNLCPFHPFCSACSCLFNLGILAT